MSDLNNITISGRLTADPHAFNGGNGCRLAVANNRQYQKGGEWVNEACFIDVSVWSFASTKCMEKLAKGDRVTIVGRLELNVFEDQGGNTQKRHRIVASAVESPAFDTARYTRPDPQTGEMPTTTLVDTVEPEAVSVAAAVEPSEDDIPF